jgi:hypothetical protein
MSRDGTNVAGSTMQEALLDAISGLPERQVEEALAFVLFLKGGQAEERLRRRPAGDVSAARWWEACRILCGVAEPASALRDVTYPRAADLVRRIHDEQLPSGIPVMAAALEGGASGTAVKHLASLSRRLAVDVGDLWAELLCADASVAPAEGLEGYSLRLGEQTPIGELPEIEEHFDYFIMNVRACTWPPQIGSGARSCQSSYAFVTPERVPTSCR